MIKDRKELEEHLQNSLKTYKHDRNIVEQLRENLFEYGLLQGETQKIVNGDYNLNQLEKDLLCLFDFELYKLIKEPLINPNSYFTANEIKASMSRDYSPNKDKMNFPIELENVMKLTDQDFLTTVKMSFLVRLYNAGLIDYDYRSQRNAKIIKRKGKMQKAPNLNKKSVEDITKNILNGTFYPDMLTLNLEFGSNEEADELYYNQEEGNLVLAGGHLHILDGFHRLNAFVEAYLSNPERDLSVPLAIKNYDIDTARKYFGQINTVNKIDINQLKALKEERYSDKVVKQLLVKSDLKEKVSQSKFVNYSAGHMVTYNVLSDTIDQEFDINSNRDVLEITDYLKDFFDYLIGSYEEYFVDNVSETHKKSLINHNNMFVGYIVLARRFKEEDISISNLTKVLDSINFNKDNKLWSKLGILYDGNMTRNAQKQIKKYFNQIPLTEGVEASG